MFDQVSTHYDRTNALLSVGNAALWRMAATRAVNPQQGERILDIAAGTGTSSAALTRTGAHVVAADFSAGMIEVGCRPGLTRPPSAAGCAMPATARSPTAISPSASWPCIAVSSRQMPRPRDPESLPAPIV
jgi:hypothetical protein